MGQEAEICERCGISGVRVDTTAGEIVENGRATRYAAEADTWLMVSADGDLLCDDCAEGEA